VDAIHPDLETSGGLLEAERIADSAEAAVSRWPCIKSTPGLRSAACWIPLRRHFRQQLPGDGESRAGCRGDKLVTGVPKPIIDKGYVAVPEESGLGPELNDSVAEGHLRRPGYFEPTPMFGDPIVSGFRRRTLAS
jgi:L-alanine-DL-glutamate epimerase-like enolase superfamily enzyme